MSDIPETPHVRFPYPFLWPWTAAAAVGEAMGEAMAASMGGAARVLLAAGEAPDRPGKPSWATLNHVRLDLPTMELRDFSTGEAGVPVLVCAPFVLHGATIVDFAPGHSVVEALASGGCERVSVTDWRSAAPDMRFLGIDNYLAELNVAVDELGPPVDLVGLCQGGWMALIYAARFPAKVRRLVLAAAPVDLAAGRSRLSLAVDNLPLGLFDEVVRLGEGRVLGQRVLDLWRQLPGDHDAETVLQTVPGLVPLAAERLKDRYRAWYDWTVDLPGAYYHEVVTGLFKENRLAEGRLMALGRRIDLGAVRQPLYLLAADADELVAPEQLFAAAKLVGTAPADIAMAREPGSHLGLFLGTTALTGSWAGIARWLAA